MPRRERREPREVVKPPPEVVARVDDGGPWGPSDFDLPDREGDKTAIIWISAVAALVLVLLVGFLTVVYFVMT